MGSYRWETRAEPRIYARSIRACLTEPRFAKQFSARSEILTEDAVLAEMGSQENVQQVLARCTSEYAAFRACARRQARALEIFRSAVSEAHLDGRALALYGSSGLAFVLWYGGAAFYPTLLVTLAFTVCALAVATQNARSRRQLWVWASMGVFLFLTVVQQPAVEIRARRWSRAMVREAAPQVVRAAVDALLGEDHDALLLADEYAGLRSVRGREYLVNSATIERLNWKIQQIDGGTIAVSGPRGVGKTSLLQWCTDKADFSVFAQAPAAYAPLEFLTSLFFQVCESYLARERAEVPEFVRLPYLHRILGRLGPPAQRLIRWLAYAVPAAALITLGLFATVRSLQAEHSAALHRHVSAVAATVRDHAMDVWHGEARGLGLAVTCTGVLVWLLRRSAFTGKVLRRAWRVLFGITCVVLCLGPFVSLGFDPGIRHHAAALATDGTLVRWVLLFGLWVVCSFCVIAGPQKVTFAGREWTTRSVLGPLLLLIPLASLAVLTLSPSGRAILTDSQNPLRICVWLLGILLGKIRFPRHFFTRPESDLVKDCRKQLYRLQTVQSSSAAVNTGAAAQLLSLGTSHTTSLSTVPPNYPSLVEDFRRVLAAIADELHGKHQSFIVAIDEVDRLGTDAQALDFLREIKAILGVPYVHFLISVAEDVGAAFVRRGMPYRDVTDSSFDDVLHVQPGTLEDSTAILRKRADDDPGDELPRRFILLAHALSGGVPRDLMRYARRLMEVRSSPDDRELSSLSRKVILDELSETLAGFRTLLAKQQWSPETVTILGSFRNLVGHLRTACPCRDRTEQLELALEHFALHAAREPRLPTDGDLPAETRLLMDEAAGYAYFSLTLLGIFGREPFNSPLAAAAQQGPDGDPELLAQARLELAISPHSARRLVDGIRRAWGLPSPTVDPLIASVPPPRSRVCPRHHRSS
ncbi:hypothetical protein ACIP10_27990 [Streptomyces galbus]|uniref:hypothetical protein n=1 Tax=Streptomyces galbus TaxID=33898 RepID=UPI0037BDABC0